MNAAPPVLSDPERRFDVARRSVRFFAGPLAFAVVLLSPVPGLTMILGGVRSLRPLVGLA